MDKGGIRLYRLLVGGVNNGMMMSMRDLFFGLYIKFMIYFVMFLSKELGLKLINLYFEYVNF